MNRPNASIQPTFVHFPQQGIATLDDGSDPLGMLAAGPGPVLGYPAAQPGAQQGMGHLAIPGTRPAAGFGGVGMDEPDGEFWKKLHHSLRGRYLLLFFLMSLLGFAGAAAGWFSTHKIFRAEGVFHMTNEIFSFDGSSHAIPDFDQFIQTEASLIMTRPIIDKAMETKFWTDTGRLQMATADARRTPQEFSERMNRLAEDFSKNLTVEHPARTETIRVYYIDADPWVAAQAVKAVVHTYDEDYLQRQSRVDTHSVELLEAQRKDLKIKLDLEESSIASTTMRYGTDNFEPLKQAMLETYKKHNDRAEELAAALVMIEKSVPPEKAIEQLTPYQIGMVDSRMGRLVEELDNLESKYLENPGLGTRNPTVVGLKARIDAKKKQIEQYTAEFRDMQMKLMNNPGPQHGIMGSLMSSVETIRSQKDRFGQLANEAMDKFRAMGREQLELEKAKEQRGNLAKELVNVDQHIRTVIIQNQIGGRLRVVSDGKPPANYFKDHRWQFAAGGAFGGMLLPFLMMVAIGLSDKRYRYSDDADIRADDPGRPPLLGILPTLPDRLTDPQQAAIAAHCIHQVRIMLQLGMEPGHSRVYLVTSGSTGDGKTSLTMALGLSFAASGSRTLVVDGDMVGQGLTHRLKAGASSGLLEALTTGTVQGKVKKTSTANLYILPVGGAESHSAGSLSPTSAAHLLNETRKIFDVVLIDTGPILGSLEASVLAGAADGTILTVSRGQNQPLIDRAVRQLRTIGAKVTGLVFNRAERRDFHKSVASASIRSTSARPHAPRPLLSESDEPSRFGPLARCVASCMPTLPAGHAPANGNQGGQASHGNGNKSWPPAPVAGTVISSKNGDRAGDKGSEKNGKPADGKHGERNGESS